MSEPTPIPGKSLESDLRLIREARGISREEIFNRVHIRPEVLAQVEEHGFGATPTLNSDIHRRSFVKHFADAVEIDADVALAALTKSLTGFYDGSLAVEYLGLEDLKAIPRWAQHSDQSEAAPNDQTDDTQADTESQSDDTQVDKESQSDDTQVDKESQSDDAEADTESQSDDTEADTEGQSNLPQATLDFDLVPSEPEIPADVVQSASPYAPPGLTVPPEPVPRAPEPQTPLPLNPPVGQPEALPEVPAVAQVPGLREDADIPSSTLKESVIGPPDENDFGDEDLFWMRLRGRHWLTWLGLTGVVVVLLIVVGQPFFGEKKQDPEASSGITTIADLPSQFSGVVRLTPTTERFITLQIHPDSVSPTKFIYKMWTLSAGSTYAEIGEGRLNIDENQILLGEPYGVGGLFLQEGGEVRIRSVRRISFPRWEFTGQDE